MAGSALHSRIDTWVNRNRERVIDLVRDLVRIPSENHPPGGGEAEAQTFLHAFCRQQGLDAELYEISAAPGFDTHRLRNAAVNCTGRTNVVARWPGVDPSAGRSLILSGHVDVVPAAAPAAWRHHPYSAEIVAGRMFGRGAYDMKGGLVANFATLLMRAELGVELKGDLIVESVADEEFAGGHGTIAGRLRGDVADAVLIPEPSNLQAYRAHRGLRIVRLTIHGKGGLTFAGDTLQAPAHHLPELINGLVEFSRKRNRELRIPESYQHDPAPASSMITKVHANDWADDALLAVPATAQVEFFWETMPGETQAEVEQEFEDWLGALRKRTGMPVDHCYALRWMAGYQLAASHPLTRIVETHAAAVTGKVARATGAPFPCDLFLFRDLGVPAGMILGPVGNNAHAPDEWVDLGSVLELVRIYGRIVCDWCNGTKNSAP